MNEVVCKIAPQKSVTRRKKNKMSMSYVIRKAMSDSKQEFANWKYAGRPIANDTVLVKSSLVSMAGLASCSNSCT
jgi:hypothetical protein